MLDGTATTGASQMQDGRRCVRVPSSAGLHGGQLHDDGAFIQRKKEKRGIETCMHVRYLQQSRPMRQIVCFFQHTGTVGCAEIPSRDRWMCSLRINQTMAHASVQLTQAHRAWSRYGGDAVM